ncbi:hypothetical protein H5T88_04380 [bacterium]|nr:hypothetical protein [bacterium]
MGPGSNSQFSKKKVLFIAAHWFNGGMERSLKAIIENMSPEWERELAILRRIRTKIEEEKMGGFPYPKNSMITLIEAGTIITIFLSLIKLFKERQPHIISTHITPSGARRNAPPQYLTHSSKEPLKLALQRVGFPFARIYLLLAGAWESFLAAILPSKIEDLYWRLWKRKLA